MDKALAFFHKNIVWFGVGFAALSAAAQQFGFPVPEFAYTLAAALGLAGYRAHVATVTGTHGWKSYAVAALAGLMGALQAYGIHIPVWVDPMLAAFGFGALKVALAKPAA